MKTSDFFLSINEPFAAGLFEFPEDVPVPRYANALKSFFTHAKLPPYEEGALYPAGKCSKPF